MYRMSKPRFSLVQIVVALALVASSCAHKKSDEDSPAPTTNQPQKPTAPTSDQTGPAGNTGADGVPDGEHKSDSLSTLKLLKSSTVNGVKKSYFLLAVGHGPSQVTDITGIQMVNEQGNIKDVLSDAMSKKTYYGVISKSALENSGYFNMSDKNDLETIKEILADYEGAKLLVVSPAPSAFLASDASGYELKIIAKTSDGSTLEN